jgi:VIT1/CCC1 family predicted Fe2+/Mn2+ transporter
MGDSADRGRIRANLQGEIDGAALYKALAEVEADPKLAEVYRRLSAVEEAHAEFWRKRLGAAGGRPASLRPAFRARALAWLAQHFGADLVLPIVAAQESEDQTAYDNQPDAAAAGLPQDERSHARVLDAMKGARLGVSTGSVLGRLEGRHRAVGGNALRAAVLGANDGLVSNLSLVMGVAGAALDAHSILITGLAGLLAGSCSMAMGEWLSVTSAREANQRQIDAEAEELQAAPEEEEMELALIYQAKGLPEEQAKGLAKRLISNKATALDTLSREELGIDPAELGGSPWQAAGASFALFALGAIFPVAPFIFMAGWTAVGLSLALAGLALMIIGAVTSLVTGRGLLLSALRQLAIGLAAAAVTYGIGRAIGIAVTG